MKYALIPALLLAGFTAGAQQRQLTMAEATNGLATTLAVQNIRQPSWQPGTHNFFQVVKSGKLDAWVRTAFPSAQTDTVLYLPRLSERVFRSKDSLKSLPAISWLSKDLAWFRQGRDIYQLRLKGNSADFTGTDAEYQLWLTLPVGADNIQADASGMLVFTVENNLWIKPATGPAYALTTDGSEDIVYGQAVHRNEFGIDKGIFISPKGNLVAYYRMDQGMVPDYPVVDWSQVPAQNKNIKYPMAGDSSHQVSLEVFNPASGASIRLQTGAGKDHYLTAVSWSPDERHIYVGLLNRDQNHLKLNQYDAATGRLLRTLFEEKDERYVEPQHPMTFLPGSNDQFIWWSQRDGFMHLYLYRTDGKLIRQLTKGNWLVTELIGFNPERSEVLIKANRESPLEQHAYAVSWKKNTIRQLSPEAGQHNASASEDGRFIYDVYSAAGVPRRALVRAADGRFSRELLNAPNPLANYQRPEIRNVQLKADDGTPLYGKLILPTGFDSSRRYPVIVYLYNGPHLQLVRNSFPESGNLWYEYMAQRGYVVFTMDGRGSSNRGLKFEQAVFRNLGTVEMQDQLQGVAYLKSLPYVDASRMGVHGWSFGGFMTTSLMLRHPGVFQVGVAGGPVIDWRMYEVMYTERYMDTPQQNPEGYEQSNLLNHVKNLKGRLLQIHGTSDDVVVWQHSINFVKKCIDEGVQLDYFMYPGHLHNVRGKDRVHLMQKITDYFDLHLKP